MYQLTHTDPSLLKSITVERQPLILELTGSELNLQQAFQLVKQASKNFTQRHTKALEADKLLAKLLTKHNIPLGKADTQDQSAAKEEVTTGSETLRENTGQVIINGESETEAPANTDPVPKPTSLKATDALDRARNERERERALALLALELELETGIAA